MFDIKFTEAYYPELDSIDPEKLAAARAFVVSRLRPVFGDIDLSPGTATGDLVVTPLSAFVAASDEAHGRLMSDLDLENVANGVIYSCDFVRAYLGNFGVYDVDNLRSGGLVRLTFLRDQTYTINRSVRYVFAGQEFSVRFDDDTTNSFVIRPSSTVPDGAANTAILAQTSAVTFSVDVPVEGVMTEAIARGAAGLTNYVWPELIGITAAANFFFGLAPTSLPDLARLARRTAMAATANTRNGTAAMIFRNWPESVMVSPIITGDAEMQRSAPGSALVLQAPSMDVYYQSTQALQVEKQIVRLPLSNDYIFRGPITFLHRPAKIISVKWAGHTTGVNAHRLFSQSSRVDLAGSLYCGTSFERFWIEVDSAQDSFGVPVIARSTVDDSANFEITYVADPVLRSVAGVLQASDNRAPGVDVLVKAGPLIAIQSLAITYRKEPGVKVLTSAARTKIVEAINAAAWPAPFDISTIYTIMRTAGASAVVDIAVAGDLTLTPAERRFRPLFVPVAVDTDDWSHTDNSVAAPVVALSDVEGLTPNTIHVSSSGGLSEIWAATERTVRYYITEDAITFQET